MFKRYIKRHGKKLGPYYYENVRCPNGKIRTVYVGSNLNEHPKHRLRKPLIFLIVVLLLILILGSSMFLLQNKAYIINKVNVQEPDFDIDQILLKVLIRSNEFIEKQIRIVNIGTSQIFISSEVTGLSDIVSIDPSSFAIKPGQTKIVVLNFSSFMPEQGIEQQPGVYVGKLVASSEKYSKEIPIVVEIEARNVLFDMNLNPVAIERKVKQGSEATIEVRLFNLESIESENIDVEYFAKDMSGNTILTESETVVVKTQASFFKTLSIPKNLKPGTYVFAALAKFGTSVGTASYLFEVVGPEQEESFVQFCRSSLLCLGLSLTTILLLFVLTAYFYFFVGAYLYEKLTGVILAPKRKGEEEFVEEEEPKRIKEEKVKKVVEEVEKPKPGIFEGIKTRLGEWKKERAREKAEERKLEEELELLKPLPEEAKEAKPRKKSDKDKLYYLLDELDEAINIKDISKAESLHAQSKELYATLESHEQEEVHGKLAELESRKNKLAGDIVRQERLREKEKLSKQKELERQKAEEEKKELKEERLRQKEDLAKQKELEKQRALEEKRDLEEERKRQQELERQKQEQIKSQKLEIVKQLEAKLSKNREIAEHLNPEMRRLESEKIALSGNINKVDSRITHINNEIFSTAKDNEELSQQRHSLFERYRKQIEDIGKEEETQKAGMDSRIKELKEEFESKKAALAKQLEIELRKLSPSKRKSVEKWKRVELKAKLKIEEQNFEDELKKCKSGKSSRRIEADGNYKKSLAGIGEKQRELRDAIASLESQKQQELLQKQGILKNLEYKGKEIQKLNLKLERIAKEQEQIKLELSKLKLGLNIKDFFRDLTSSYRKKALEKKAQKLEEKRRREEQRKIGEEARAKEEIENKQKELERQRADEEKRKLEEERKKISGRKKSKKEMLKEEEKEEKPIFEVAEQKKPEKKKWFAGLFKREKPELEFKDIVGYTEEDTIPEKKPVVFGKILQKAEREEKPAEQKKPKSEVEELEEAIRSLGLFKKIDTGKIKPTEKLLKEPGIVEKLIEKGKQAMAPKEEIEGQKPEARESVFKRLFGKRELEEEEKEAIEQPELIGKSRQFKKCYNVLNKVKEAIANGNIPKAKKIYVEARELYIGLEDEEKKEVYDELMDLYNKLK